MSEHYIQLASLHSRAHVKFLEQLSEQEFQAYAEQLAAAADSAVPAPVEEYLECVITIGHCILPLATLREVVPFPHSITRLPVVPAWMAGVVAWHSDIIPVLDLSAFLTQQPARTYPDSMLLIVQHDDFTFGLLVAMATTLTALEPALIVSAEQAVTHYPQVAREMISGGYGDALILNMPPILAALARHIGGAFYG